jgi:hypothetical protein
MIDNFEWRINLKDGVIFAVIPSKNRNISAGNWQPSFNFHFEILKCVFLQLLKHNFFQDL